MKDIYEIVSLMVAALGMSKTIKVNFIINQINLTMVRSQLKVKIKDTNNKKIKIDF